MTTPTAGLLGCPGAFLWPGRRCNVKKRLLIISGITLAFSLVTLALTLPLPSAAIQDDQIPFTPTDYEYMPLLLQGADPAWTATNTPTRTGTPTLTPTTTDTPTITDTPTSTGTPTDTPTSTDVPNCHPSYPSVCIPPPPPDLDCGEIPYRDSPVLPPDPHDFDRDNDGIGCET